MEDELFIIAIGGTGMRCLESFVHLCAAGMFDGKEINILTLDTDQSNGNKGRVESLISLYNKIKTSDSNQPGGLARSNTFFSAKLNLYKFFTDYSTTNRRNFKLLSDPGNSLQQVKDDNEALSELFFDPETVQDFPLDHGYRAQTHLGSMLMYHGILEAARAVKKGNNVKDEQRELQNFLQLLNNAPNSRVFVFGSVFGGTGASSIPVIPMALKEAVRIITSGNNALNLQNVKFGSTLLTDYFTFDTPDDRQLKSDKVIADANNFTLNSQAAMSFYDGDLTVSESYKVLYHIGWPSSMKINYSESQGDTKVLTGGQEQKNDCHLVELMSASAAHDFFTREVLEQRRAEYVFRMLELTDATDRDSLRLTGASFMGEEYGPIFEEKLGSLLSLSHLILSRYKGGKEGINGTREFLKDLKARNIEDYKGITDEQARNIDEYLKEFAYKFLNGRLEPGWLLQIKRSIGSGSFIFAPDALSTNPAKLMEVDPGAIYSDDKYHWTYGGFIGNKADRRLSKFIDLLVGKEFAPTSVQGTELKEKFIGNLYNAIIGAQANKHQA